MSSDFQSQAVRQGQDFEALVMATLQWHGWTILDLNSARCGVEIDIIALDPDGMEWWIECKGAQGTSKRKPGCADGTTVKVAVGVAYHIATYEEAKPYLLVTSDLPNPGTVPALMLDRVIAAGALTDVVTFDGLRAMSP